MRSFVCPYTSRQKTASRIFLLIICEFRIIRPPLHPLTPTPITCGFTAGTDYHGFAVPLPWFSGPAMTLWLFAIDTRQPLRLHSCLPSWRDAHETRTACHRGETRTKREPNACQL